MPSLASILSRLPRRTGDLARQILALTLILLVTLPVALPRLSTSATAGRSLPACCRRGGEHHCAAVGSTAPTTGQPSLSARCPFQTPPTPLVHSATNLLVVASSLRISPVRAHPACPAQVASRRRIAQDRSRQKRGPPGPSLPSLLSA